jgi:hypothetical protein
VVKADAGGPARSERALTGLVLLLDVLAEHGDRAPPTDPAKYEPDHSRFALRQWRRRSGNSGRIRREETPFSELTNLDRATFGREVHEEADVTRLAVELG